MDSFKSSSFNDESLLIKHKEYFDNMFKGIDNNIILDKKQRAAVLSDNDNLLVVAGAGSGKTTTMVAKVKYLIDKCGYKERDIVVISFTKKVEAELKKMINEDFNLKHVTVSTFHALGLRIINAAGYNYTKIVDEKGQYSILTNYIKNILFKDKEKLSLFISAFSNKLYFNKDWEKYDTFHEYHNAMYETKKQSPDFDIIKYNSYQINTRLDRKRTIMGQYLKSKEEVKIANFLYYYGIYYKYEKKFNKAGKLTRNFPDFYISQLGNENYIEHFGVDQKGHNDMYTDLELSNYLKSLNKKKKVLEQQYYKDLFIITYSKYNDNRTFLDDLKRQLFAKGYYLKARSSEEIFNKLRDTSTDSYYNDFIEKIVVPFISLFKQQGYKINYFDQLINENSGDLKKQLIVLKDFFVHYQNVLDKNRYIDFEDMIYKAYEIMPIVKEKQLGVDYKYLIIDEYQDISSARLDLVNRMSKLFDAKIMAVGDDWQTIFGYSGSRIDLFKNFEKEMKDAKSIPIENTYRNSQELVDVAGEFILKNEDQITKKLKSSKSLDNPVRLIVYDDKDKNKLDFNRSKILYNLLDKIYKHNQNARVLLLGRYKNDKYKIDNPKLFKIYQEKIVSLHHPNLKIDFLTIHKAKGLGYDYCVLLDLVDGTYGFPSKVENDPIIKLIQPKINEPIDYPEERRLFYVALTRTKNNIFMLVPQSKKSSFATEIEDYDNVESKDYF